MAATWYDTPWGMSYDEYGNPINPLGWYGAGWYDVSEQPYYGEYGTEMRMQYAPTADPETGYYGWAADPNGALTWTDQPFTPPPPPPPAYMTSIPQEYIDYLVASQQNIPTGDEWQAGGYRDYEQWAGIWNPIIPPAPGAPPPGAIIGPNGLYDTTPTAGNLYAQTIDWGSMVGYQPGYGGQLYNLYQGPDQPSWQGEYGLEGGGPGPQFYQLVSDPSQWYRYTDELMGTHPSQWSEKVLQPYDMGQWYDFGPGTTAYDSEWNAYTTYPDAFAGYTGPGYYAMGAPTLGYNESGAYDIPGQMTRMIDPSTLAKNPELYFASPGLNGQGLFMGGINDYFGWGGAPSADFGNHPGYANMNYNGVLAALNAVGMGGDKIDYYELALAGQDFAKGFDAAYGMSQWSPDMNNYAVRSTILQSYLNRTGLASTPGGQALIGWVNSPEYINAGLADYYGPVTDYVRQHAAITDALNGPSDLMKVLQGVSFIASFAMGVGGFFDQVLGNFTLGSLLADATGIGTSVMGPIAPASPTLTQSISAINQVLKASGIGAELGLDSSLSQLNQALNLAGFGGMSTDDIFTAIGGATTVDPSTGDILLSPDFEPLNGVPAGTFDPSTGELLDPDFGDIGGLDNGLPIDTGLPDPVLPDLPTDIPDVGDVIDPDPVLPDVPIDPALDPDLNPDVDPDLGDIPGLDNGDPLDTGLGDDTTNYDEILDEIDPLPEDPIIDEIVDDTGEELLPDPEDQEFLDELDDAAEPDPATDGMDDTVTDAPVDTGTGFNMNLGTIFSIISLASGLFQTDPTTGGLMPRTTRPRTTGTGTGTGTTTGNPTLDQLLGLPGMSGTGMTGAGGTDWMNAGNWNSTWTAPQVDPMNSFSNFMTTMQPQQAETSNDFGNFMNTMGPQSGGMGGMPMAPQQGGPGMGGSTLGDWGRPTMDLNAIFRTFSGQDSGSPFEG